MKGNIKEILLDRKGFKKNKTMNKIEAIQAMEQGKKVTHRYFSPDEWMTIENGMIVTEDGCKTAQSVFWNYRQDQAWNKDYEIFKTKEAN